MGSCSNTACREAAVDVPPPTPVLRFTTGSPGGSFHAFGEALSAALSATSPQLNVATQMTAGAVQNIEAIEAHRADFGIAFADVAYLAWIGALDTQSRAYEDLRAMTIVRLTPVHLLARDPHVMQVPDLKGKRIAIGPDGSGTALTARLILEAFGLPLSSVVPEAMQFREAGTHLAAGQIDAMFDNGVYEATSVVEALRAGAHLVPITGARVDQLRRTYPFFKRTVIPRGMYGLPAAVATIGVDSLLICRRDLPEQLVYELTAQVFEAFRSFSASEFLDLVELDQAAAVPIPLHEGAARFFREQELLR